MPLLALSEAEALKLATAIVSALALAVTVLWWRSEKAHELHRVWATRLVGDLLALLERRRVTDAEIAAALRGLVRDPKDDETKEVSR